MLAYAKLDRRRSGAGGTRAPISGVQLGLGAYPPVRVTEGAVPSIRGGAVDWCAGIGITVGRRARFDWHAGILAAADCPVRAR